MSDEKINISTTSEYLYQALISDRNEGISIKSYKEVASNTVGAYTVYEVVLTASHMIGISVLSGILSDAAKKSPNKDTSIDGRHIIDDMTVSELALICQGALQ